MRDRDVLLWIGVILVILAVLLLLYTYQDVWAAEPEDVTCGYVTYQNPGLMEATARSRGAETGIATTDRTLLGRWVQVWRSGVGWSAPLPVVDVAQVAHVQWNRDRGRIFELAYPLARQWGMVRVGPVWGCMKVLAGGQ